MASELPIKRIRQLCTTPHFSKYYGSCRPKAPVTSTQEEHDLSSYSCQIMALTSYSSSSLSLSLFVFLPFCFEQSLSSPIFCDKQRHVEYCITSVLGLPTCVFVASKSCDPSNMCISNVHIIQLLLTIDILVLVSQRSGFAEMNPSEVALYLQVSAHTV